jgi:hypothetical protein
MLSITDIAYCCWECESQRNVTPMGVYNMVKALNYTRFITSNNYTFDENFIKTIANVVAPTTKGEYRTIPLITGPRQQSINWKLIPDSISALVCNHHNLSALEFQKEFEVIQPFIEGNHQIGSLLFNVINDTLDIPIKTSIAGS